MKSNNLDNNLQDKTDNLFNWDKDEMSKKRVLIILYIAVLTLTIAPSNKILMLFSIVFMLCAISLGPIRLSPIALYNLFKITFTGNGDVYKCFKIYEGEDKDIRTLPVNIHYTKHPIWISKMKYMIYYELFGPVTALFIIVSTGTEKMTLSMLSLIVTLIASGIIISNKYKADTKHCILDIMYNRK